MCVGVYMFFSKTRSLSHRRTCVIECRASLGTSTCSCSVRDEGDYMWVYHSQLHDLFRDSVNFEQKGEYPNSWLLCFFALSQHLVEACFALHVSFASCAVASACIAPFEESGVGHFQRNSLVGRLPRVSSRSNNTAVRFTPMRHSHFRRGVHMKKKHHQGDAPDMRRMMKTYSALSVS